jgi:hypothetical protein
MTCQDLDPQDKGKVEEVLKLSLLAVTFDHKEEEGNITGCIYHIQLLHMADKKPAVHQDKSREEGAYPLHLQGAGIEVGKYTREKNMEEDVQVQGDEWVEKAKEYKIWGIKTTHLYGSKERKASIDVGNPERKPPFFDQCTKEIAERIPIIHQITGEYIISDYNPLHECEFIEREESKYQDGPYDPQFTSIQSFPLIDCKY